LICIRDHKINVLPQVHLRKGSNGGCSECAKITIIKYSKQQIEWLNYCSISSGFIQHAENVGEFQIAGTGYYADGFQDETNTIYEFQGDFWHGNPKRFNKDTINPRTGTTYGSLYERTLNKIQKIEELGYTVLQMWESDWDQAKKAVKMLQTNWKKSKNSPSSSNTLSVATP